jgi:D-3-phosphoglycerate dehydrogenase / 2-oxoglutarate reductase
LPDKDKWNAWIANLDGGYDGYEKERALLAELGYDLRIFEGGRHDRAAKLAFARGALGIFLRWTELDDAAFAALPSVKYAVRYGVGYDNVDLDAATRHGVLVCNVQGYATHSVSDHALALTLSCLRCLHEGGDQLVSHYGTPPRDPMPELHELTAGIVGLGRIGGMYCRKIRPLVRRVLACDPYIPEDRFEDTGAVKSTLDTVLSESDIISIHCNLTEKTAAMFDTAAFAAMRPGAILINTARGPIVNEDALTEALNSGRLAGAGIDVFHDEPPRENRRPLLDHPRVTATGHYAWFSTPASRELQRRAGRNMAEMLQGRIPEDALNP